MANSSKKMIEIESSIEKLSESSRKARKDAASALLEYSKAYAQEIVPYGDEIIEALQTSDVHTRWLLIDVLTALSSYDNALCQKALPDIDNALFDEFNGPLHLASVRFLCTYGATSPQASDEVWPLLNEAIQCFHGDQEFQDMLNLLVEFSKGKLSDATKASFKERMSFDASNNKGLIQRRAKTIVDNLS